MKKYTAAPLPRICLFIRNLIVSLYYANNTFSKEGGENIRHKEDV